MSGIKRIDSSERLSRAIVHGSTVYLSGLTDDDVSGDASEQTRQVLAKVDHYLGKAGTNRAGVLHAQIFLRDIGRDFDSMNSVWASWLDGGPPPTRATVQAELAEPEILVEIVVTAAAGAHELAAWTDVQAATSD